MITNKGSNDPETTQRASLEILELLAESKAKDTPSVAPKIPPGCVERVLTVRDRNMIVGACMAYVEKNKSLKDMRMLVRVKEALDFEATVEYFAQLDASITEAVEEWQRARIKRKLWLDWRAGILREEDIRRQLPNFNLDEEPPKPPARPPQASAEEKRGPERTFYIPAKLDAWIEDALRAMEWEARHAEGGVAVAEKYGIEG
jgi:hypothetical protein